MRAKILPEAALTPCTVFLLKRKKKTSARLDLLVGSAYGRVTTDELVLEGLS